jgi:hypothetical protein
MGTVLSFEAPRKARPRALRSGATQRGEIIIFPGVRIERHDVDLGHRLRDSAGRGDFDGLGGNRRPRKTS